MAASGAMVPRISVVFKTVLAAAFLCRTSHGLASPWESQAHTRSLGDAINNLKLQMAAANMPGVAAPLGPKVATPVLPPAASVAPKATVQAAPPSVGMVPVPVPPHADSKGFPKLPPVSNLLLSASSTVQTLNSQASALEARVVQAEMASEKKMAKQKILFEQKLQAQETDNLVVVAQNDKIRTQIASLSKLNDILRKRGKEITSTNHVLLMELRLMKAKLNMASQFVSDSQKVTLLAISEKDKAMASDPSTVVAANSFVSALGDLAGGAATPPQSQDMNVPKAPLFSDVTPDSLLSVLSKDVSNLKKQEQESEKTLKKLFVNDYKVGAKRHSALLLQQKSLIASRTALLNERQRLKDEQKVLLATRAKLQHRLHNVGEFLKSLSQMADAPVSQVPVLLKSMPKHVSV